MKKCSLFPANPRKQQIIFASSRVPFLKQANSSKQEFVLAKAYSITAKQVITALISIWRVRVSIWKAGKAPYPRWS
jgi:hypothetical protein